MPSIGSYVPSALPAHDRLSSQEFQRSMFDLVNQMKLMGLQHSIDLPQLIVCGDQSSGKSSVLSSIARLEFPTKDTLCTMFATELVMRQTSAEQPPALSIRILPSETRNESDKLRLQIWAPSTTNLRQFSDIVSQAGLAMRDGSGVARFSEDVLRIELSGSDLQNLDLVDLPGLFHGAGPGQTSSDVDKVRNLVLRYMAKKRTVVLAIISAKEDLASQVVTSLVGQCQASDRTLAVITKPDTLDEEPNKQEMFIQAMENSLPELSFDLGWHVLRNKKYTEQTSSWEERDRVESTFFKAGAWTQVSEERKGISALVSRLQMVQGLRIVESAEAMENELTSAITRGEEQLATLQPKATTVDMLSISQQFCSLISKAVNGPYTHDFFKKSADYRLGQVTEGILTSFATQMNTRGHKWNITASDEPPVPSTEEQQPMNISRADFIEMLCDKLAAAGAMPGQFVQEVFDDVFYEQAQAWLSVINRMTEELVGGVSQCVMAILVYACRDVADPEKLFDALVKKQLDSLHDEFKMYVNRKTKGLVSRSEIVLDPQIKNQVVPLAFRNEWRNIVQARVPDLHDLFGDLKVHTAARMRDENQARIAKSVTDLMTKGVSIQNFNAAVMEATLTHYYKVQLQKTIDHFDSENVNTHLLSKLPSLFPQGLATTLSTQVSAFITEDPELVQKRADLSERLNKLRELHQKMHDVVQKTKTNEASILPTRKRSHDDAEDNMTRMRTPDKKSRRVGNAATPRSDRRK